MAKSWTVQTAYTLDDYPLTLGEEFWVTQKMNGVRATLYNGALIGRSGTEYTGLDHILNSLTDIVQQLDIVLDGELVLKDAYQYKDDNEAFRIASGIVRSDLPAAKTEIEFVIFDLVPREDFESSEPQITYRQRREAMEQFSIFLNTENSRVLPVIFHGTDPSVIPELLKRVTEIGREGLMINLNVPYYRKRHKGILKVKQFYTMDLPILRCEEGSGRLKGTLGALVVDYHGNEVHVGTGFTDEERARLWEKRTALPGQICEVKYKDISFNQAKNAYSLQFPSYVGLRTDKTEPSFW